MKLTAVVIMIFISGCAIDQMKQANLAEAQDPLTCADKQQCDFYWQRAQAYIGKHSTYRIQSVTDTVLATYGPMDGKMELAYQLTKVPNADGSATIELRLACDNLFGCTPDPASETKNLKRFVRGL